LSSIERAKAFMQRRARLIAVTALPLAALVGIAAPAHAGAVTTPLTLTPSPCVVTATGGTLNSGGSCATSALATGANGMTGVKGFGDATATAGLILTQGIEGSQVSGNPLTLDFLVGNGTTNGGTVSGVIPVHYSFSITDSDSTTADITWELILSATVLGQNTVIIDSLHNGVVADGTLISSALNTNPLPPTAVTGYKVELKVTDTSATSGQFLHVNIPQNSIDVNAISSAPEPGTFALLGSALAGIGGFAWRRRRAKS